MKVNLHRILSSLKNYGMIIMKTMNSLYHVWDKSGCNLYDSFDLKCRNVDSFGKYSVWCMEHSNKH